MVVMIVNMNEETNEFPSKLKSEHFSTSVKDKKNIIHRSKQQGFILLTQLLGGFVLIFPICVHF